MGTAPGMATFRLVRQEDRITQNQVLVHALANAQENMVGYGDSQCMS